MRKGGDLLLGLLIWRGVRILIHLEGKPTPETKKIVEGIVQSPESIRNLYFVYKDAVVVLSENHHPIPTRTGGGTHLIPKSVGESLIRVVDGFKGFMTHEEFLKRSHEIGFNISELTERRRPYAPSLIFPSHPNPWDKAFRLLEMRADLGMPVRFIHLKDDDYLLVYRGEKVHPHEEFFDLETETTFPELDAPEVVGCTKKACYIVDVENVIVKESGVFIPEDLVGVSASGNEEFDDLEFDEYPW